MSIWAGKIVVITGGSKGLGAELTRQFADAGARVYIIARDEPTMNKFVRDFAENTGKTIGIRAADVTDANQAQKAIDSIIDEAGRIDWLVNNVGASTRVVMTQAAPDIFRKQMEANFFSAVNCTQAALATLVLNRGGVINIASLAARTPWPLMSPYVTSKAALAAYTDQLRFEVAGLGTVLLVCPGPIQRDDAGSRYKVETAGLSESAGQPGAGAKIKGLDPKRVAKKILAAAAAGRRELVLPAKARVLFFIANLFPRLGDWLRRQFNSNRP